MSTEAATAYLSPFASTHEVLLTARLLQTLFLRSLNSSFLHYVVTDLDFYLVGGPKNLHGIKPGLAQGLWYTLQCLGRIILCAAHNYVPGVSQGPLPHCIPLEALQEVQMNFPAVVFAEIYPDNNPLVSVQPVEGLRLTIGTLQCVGRQGVKWITEAMRRSAKKGEESLWRWGGFVELRDAHPSDFGIFADRVLEEVGHMRRQSLVEEMFEGSEDDEDGRRGSCHFESEVIDDLRRFLVSHTSVFSLQSHHWVKLKGEAKEEDRPAELDDLVKFLDHLGLTDVVGIPVKTWDDDWND